MISRFIMLVAALTSSTSAMAGPKRGRAANSPVCQTAAAGVGVVGTAMAGASGAAGAAGISALTHSSGAAILSSVGVGGTGYIAGTLGGAAATGLAFVSTPAVIAVGAAVAVGAVGTVVYCRSRRQVY